jgi:hypothetical protein
MNLLLDGGMRKLAEYLNIWAEKLWLKTRK